MVLAAMELAIRMAIEITDEVRILCVRLLKVQMVQLQVLKQLLEIVLGKHREQHVLVLKKAL